MINVLLFNHFCIPGQYNAHNSFFNTICSYDCVHFGPEQLLDFMTHTNEFNCDRSGSLHTHKCDFVFKVSSYTPLGF